jgi:hypothetical protein
MKANDETVKTLLEVSKSTIGLKKSLEIEEENEEILKANKVSKVELIAPSEAAAAAAN